MNPILLVGIISALAGAGVGFVTKHTLTQKNIREAEQKQKELVLKAKDEAFKIREEAKKEIDQKRRNLDEREKRIITKDENLDRRYDQIESEKNKIAEQQKIVAKIKTEIDNIKQEQKQELKKITKLDDQQAKDLLLAIIEREFKDEVIEKIKASKQAAKDEAKNIAKEIIATVIARMASDHTAETTVSNVALPSDEMKGRIIGREGRNIQAFEKATGVDVLIDDTPDTVTISSFDPMRRYIAKVSLEKLISDGRIQPARIEEIIEKTKKEVAVEVKEAGEAAAFEVGVAGLHPDLIKILGRLKFRTSYGQSVLKHSVEVAQLAGMLAYEIGADAALCKKAGLLHDLGKAVDHEVPGAHHHISMDILRKYGASETLINAVGAHHDDIEPKTVEAIVVRSADAISGSRPGARHESLESYIKRLTELENIANSFTGVEKSYAIQAGREVRIIVKPEDIDDLAALKLSQNIAKKIETDLQYPGTIKVNVIREVRATEFAK